eukprot:symbB.v1.2.006108.t3/scaffold364.1/size219240/5
MTCYTSLAIIVMACLAASKRAPAEGSALLQSSQLELGRSSEIRESHTLDSERTPQALIIVNGKGPLEEAVSYNILWNLKPKKLEFTHSRFCLLDDSVSRRIALQCSDAVAALTTGESKFKLFLGINSKSLRTAFSRQLEALHCLEADDERCASIWSTSKFKYKLFLFPGPSSCEKDLESQLHPLKEMAKGEKLHASIWSKDGNRKTADEVLSGVAFAAFRKYPILSKTFEGPKPSGEGRQRPEILILGSGPSEEDPDDKRSTEFLESAAQGLRKVLIVQLSRSTQTRGPSGGQKSTATDTVDAERVLKSVASDCLFGVLTVILQSLPAIDYEKGRNETQEILDIADDLVAIFEQQPDRDDIWSSASSAGWDVDALVRTTRLYRRMLQPIAGEKCQLKVYVYPPPKLSSAPRSLLQTEAGYFGAMSAGMPLQCLFGMYGTELLFHQWFLREAAACRSTPEDADLFYVPSYFKCIEVLNYFDRFNHQENEASILFNQTLQYVKDASGNWWRNGGADHIFLFSWGRHPCRIPAWREPLQSVIQLQVEDHCEDLNFQSPEASFSRWKDVIIPGHIDEWRVAELRRSNRPLQRRDVLVSFHGRYAGNTDSYGNVTVRSKIMKHLSGLPGVSVGGFVEEYHTLMGRSRFCLAPRGITPWTIHLFVSMLAGCIPVILSDDLEAPFQDLLDWSSFSIKWPTDRVEDLYEYLKSLPADLVLDMKSAVDRNSCWFDYYSQNPGCEPFSAVTTILQKRVAQRPGFAGKFWAPLVGHGHRLVAGFFIKTVLNEDRVSLLREPVDDSEAEHVLQILCSIVLVLLVCLVLAMFTSSDDIRPKLEPEGDAHHSTLPHAATSAVPLSAQGPTGLRPVQTWPAVDQSLEEVDRHYVSSPQSSLNSVRFTSESMVPPTRGLVVPGGSECVLAVRLPTSSVFLEAQVDVMDLTGQAVLAATLRLSNQQARDPAVVLKPTSATPNGNVANQELARCYANRGSDGEIGIDICKALLMNILQRHSLTSRTSRHLVTMDVSADLVAFAEELADAAGNVIRKYWRKPVEIESKHEPGRPVAESPVTLADREAEEAMRKLIEARLVLSVLKRPRIARQSIHRREAAMAIRRVPPTLPSALKARYLARALRRFSSDLFLPSDQFAQRHLGPLPADVQEMCKVIGVKDLSELMEKAIPASVRREQPMELPDGQLGESGSLALLKEMLSKNVIAKNYIGMGYHGSHVPGPILRNLLENPGWYTAYTPYQAEISQGRLESLVNYQTLVCELTGMEVANASLLDEGTAAAEAMAMIARAVNSKAKNQFFISDSVHPQSIDCIKTRAKYFGMELVIGDHTTTDFASMDKLCGALVQYPDTRGRYFKFEGIADALHKNGAYFIVAADPLSLVLAKPPSEIGADVVVGSMQRFGVPMWFGGPSAAYLATSKKQVRRMPGRLIGESLDRLGNPAYRLTLQTREQHIRLDKATSNVCTAQVLLANMAGMYAVYHRKDGLKKIAARVHGLAQLFAKEAQAAGLTLASTTAFFDTVSFETSKAKAIAQELEKQKMNVRVLDDKTLAASFDETHLEADVMALTLPGLVLSSSRRSLIPFPQRLS